MSSKSIMSQLNAGVPHEVLKRISEAVGDLGGSAPVVQRILTDQDKVAAIARELLIVKSYKVVVDYRVSLHTLHKRCQFHKFDFTFLTTPSNYEQGQKAEVKTIHLVDFGGRKGNDQTIPKIIQHLSRLGLRPANLHELFALFCQKYPAENPIALGGEKIVRGYAGTLIDKHTGCIHLRLFHGPRSWNGLDVSFAALDVDD